MCVFSQVHSASVLFVDNPVGTGFSYVEAPEGYATDVAMVASDMLVLLREFFTKTAEFQVCVCVMLLSLLFFFFFFFLFSLHTNNYVQRL